MPTAGLYRGKSRVGLVELPGDIFNVHVNVPLMHQVVVAQLAAARQGTHSTKTRGETRGGGRKPYRQKGTGRARQGSTRAPQFAGGGVAHGPHPRDYAQRTPKKMKAGALRSALTSRAQEGAITVVDALVEGDVPKTKPAVQTLDAIIGDAKVLLVASLEDSVTWKSLRNVPHVHLIDPGQLNTYDVVTSDQVVFTATAYDDFVTRSRRKSSRWVADAVAMTARRTGEDNQDSRGEPSGADPNDAVHSISDRSVDSQETTPDGAPALLAFALMTCLLATAGATIRIARRREAHTYTDTFWPRKRRADSRWRTYFRRSHLQYLLLILNVGGLILALLFGDADKADPQRPPAGAALCDGATAHVSRA